MPDATVTPVPFQEAIDYFRQKVSMPTRTWTDLWEGMHARGFVVAGAMKADLVADLRMAVDKAIANGTTLAEFRRDFDTVVAKHGWSYNGGRNWRTDVIFSTNTRMAYAAGKWKQALETKDTKPFLRYIAILDNRTRPDHQYWNGTVLPMDDPWWSTHYPPNGWRCRCTVDQLGPRDLKRYGYEVSDSPPPVEMEPRAVRTPDGGKVTVQVPKGIDTGFGYNVGQAGYGYGESRAAMEKHGPWEALEAPGGNRPSAPAPLEAVKPVAKLGPHARPGDAEDLRRVWREGIGADAVTLKDPMGERVHLTQAIVDHMLEASKRFDGREAVFPLLPELVQHPAEIWMGWAKSSVTGRVAIRRRYVRLYDTGKDKVVALVADLDNGAWSGLTTMPAQPRYLKRLRSGLRVYHESEEE